MNFSRNVLISTLAAAVIAVFSAGIALSQAPVKQLRAKSAAVRAEPIVHQLIVKLRNPTAAEKVSALGSARVSSLSKSAGVQLKALRAMSGNASLLALDAPMNLSEAQALSARLAADPAVEYAEPDMPVKRFQVTPPDTSFPERQWYFQIPGTNFNSRINTQTGGTKTFLNVGGANFMNAWTTTTGVSTVRIAVIDSGVTLDHPDLVAALIPSSGYDFVSADVRGFPVNFVANDGDGRDANPTDPGDWITQQDKTNNAGCRQPNEQPPYAAEDSSWHGTHMTGVAAAAWGGGTVSGTSIAGAAPNVRIVPVRALGKCGGISSDVIDAMRWSAGLTTAGGGQTWASLDIPTNPNPAKVLNLSLGGPGSCGQTYQNAVNEIVAAGVSIFVATGNEAGPVGSPANCNGVIAVTAHVINGDNADYANVGSQTTISAPGGGTGTVLPVPNLLSSDSANWIWSAVLFGATTPASNGSGSSSGSSGPAISGFTGTSPATPPAAATAALMLSVRLTATPAEIRAYLRASARPHPSGGYCQFDLNACGAGLLDAGRALQMFAATAPTPDAGLDQRVAPGATVNLIGMALAWGGKSVAGYAWRVESGPAVTLGGAAIQNATYVAPASGTNVLRLTVTDSGGVTGYDFVTVRVNVAPTLAPVTRSGVAGVPLTFNIVGNDPDFDALTYTVASGRLPAGASLTASGANAGAFSWPNPVMGTYAFGVVASDGLAQTAPATVSITITGGAAPAITVQPQSQTVNAGQPVTFGVTATGAPAPTYQWTRNGVNISGETGATYTIASTTATDNGVQFRVVVSNALGMVTSNPATLTVVSPPPPSGGGGGGGSLPLWNLLVMAAFAIVGGLRRRA